MRLRADANGDAANGNEASTLFVQCAELMEIVRSVSRGCNTVQVAKEAAPPASAGVHVEWGNASRSSPYVPKNNVEKGTWIPKLAGRPWKKPRIPHARQTAEAAAPGEA
jgi:hypothetical protein